MEPSAKVLLSQVRYCMENSALECQKLNSIMNNRRNNNDLLKILSKLCKFKTFRK